MVKLWARRVWTLELSLVSEYPVFLSKSKPIMTLCIVGIKVAAMDTLSKNTYTRIDTPTYFARDFPHFHTHDLYMTVRTVVSYTRHLVYLLSFCMDNVDTLVGSGHRRDVII